MSEEKVYPYIGETENGSVVLFHKDSTGRVLKHVDDIPVGRVDYDWCEDLFKNIAPKYLNNTYGEVLSPEHAEFINSLSLNCDGTTCGYGCGDNVFWFEGLDLYFGEEENSGVCIKDKKQITIPLPPKPSASKVNSDIEQAVKAKINNELEQVKSPKKSIQYLSDCMEVQKQRGEQYDSKGTGERSFAAAASAFNAMTGQNLKGSDVCLLLTCVKAVRQYSDPSRVHEDSLLDLVSYASLWAEELNKEVK